MKGPPLPPSNHATIGQALAAAAAGKSGVTFVGLHEEETFLSFRDIHERSRRAAAALRAAGVTPGDRVALVLPTAPSFTDAFFGALLAGAVPVPLYPPLRLGRMDEYHEATARMIRAVDARVVVSDRRVRTLLGPTVERARPPLGVLTAGRLVSDGGPGVELDAGPDSLALVQFSSGSTTDPKPVALSHRQLTAQLASLRALLPPERDVPQLGVSWLPLYHDMGLIGCLLLAVSYPGPLVLIPPEHFLARPALWLRAIARHRGTLSTAPAFAYSLCAKRVRDEELVGCDLSSWRLALCGAEPISADTLSRFASRFARHGFDAGALRPAYGLAEAALAVTFGAPGEGVRTVGVDAVHLARTREAVPGSRPLVSVGTPVPGVEVELRDEEGRTVRERRVGRVFVRGASVMTGYFGQPSATAQVLVDGWLDTGDLGFASGGELYVCGREKDLIIIHGANHAPQEFEECAAAVDGVRPGGVIALGFVPEGEDGERLLLFAERARGASDGGDATLAAAIRSAVLEGTGVRPHAVLVLAPGTLPRTSSGKLRRREALRRTRAGELAPPRGTGATRLALEAARSVLSYTRLRLGRDDPG